MKQEEKLKALLETQELIKSGYAGVDINGTIRDRRTTQGLIACRKNELLATPEPKPVEGEFKEGSKEWRKARMNDDKEIEAIVEKNVKLFNELREKHKPKEEDKKDDNHPYGGIFIGI